MGDIEFASTQPASKSQASAIFGGMQTTPLLKLKSHVDGKNADVEIFADRIEWAKVGGVSAGKLAAATFTGGLSLAKTGVRKGGGTEMIPVRSMASVTTKKDGLRFYKLVVVSTGNTVEFRVDKAEAEAAKTLLTQLMVGTHPAQQPAAPSAAPIATTPAPAAPEPIAQATAPTAAEPNLAERLRELANLREEGILSDDEFQQLKSKLLG